MPEIYDWVEKADYSGGGMADVRKQKEGVSSRSMAFVLGRGVVVLTFLVVMALATVVAGTYATHAVLRLVLWTWDVS